MNYNFITVAHTPDEKNNLPITIEKHIVTHKELEEYFGEELDEDEDYGDDALDYIYENKVMDWESKLIRCDIFTEEEIDSLKSYFLKNPN